MKSNEDKNSQPDARKKQVKRGRLEVDEYAEADELTADTKSDIKVMLMALSSKMDTLQESMDGIDKRLNTKIDNLEAGMTSRINDVKFELDNRIQAVSDVMDQRIDNVKIECETIVAGLVHTVNNRVDEIRERHESRIDRLERYSLERDIVISGIPMETKDDPMSIIGDICGALDCRLKQVDFTAVFRLRKGGKNSNNSRNVPIVARLQDDWAKQEITAAYFMKKNLNLTDIGFKTATRIYINERLTTINRDIFNRAAVAKKNNLIHRFYTRRGLVYIQRQQNSRPECIYHIGELDVIFPSKYDQHCNVRRGQSPGMERSSKPQPDGVAMPTDTQQIASVQSAVGNGNVICPSDQQSGEVNMSQAIN